MGILTLKMGVCCDPAERKNHPIEGAFVKTPSRD